MLLNITYLGKKKIPLTRNSFEPALKEIKVPPLLIKRFHERSNLKNIYHSYGGLFVAPSDAVDVL